MSEIYARGKRARYSGENTFEKGGEFTAIRRAVFRCRQFGLTSIDRIEVKLDNRSGGASRYAVYVHGKYSEPFSYPWHTCYSRPWEVSQYGIGKGHEDGIWGQFPSADMETEHDFVMEQLWAGELGFVEHPSAMFKAVVHIVAA